MAKILNQDIIEVNQGDTLNLVCESNGFPRPHLNWTLNNELITRENIDQLENDTQVLITKNKFIHLGNIRKNFNVSCIAYHKNFSEASLQVIVRSAKKNDYKQRLKINNNKENLEFSAKIVVEVGQNLELNCSTINETPADFVWIKANKNFIINNNGLLNLTKLTKQDSGTYECGVITQDSGFRTLQASIDLIVQDPIVKTLYVNLSQTGQISVTAEGDYALNCMHTTVNFDLSEDIEYVWYKDDESLNLVDNSPILTIKFDTLDKQGNYSCSLMDFSNKITNESQPVLITVLPTLKISSNKHIKTIQVHEKLRRQITVIENEDLELNCVIRGVDIDLEETALWFDTDKQNRTNKFVQGPKLIIKNIYADQSGIYRCHFYDELNDEVDIIVKRETFESKIIFLFFS
jgi:uncharacterized protein YodC (DUF2158 family)